MTTWEVEAEVRKSETWERSRKYQDNVDTLKAGYETKLQENERRVTLSAY